MFSSIKQVSFYLLVLVFAMSIASCVTETRETPSVKFNDTAVISVSDPNTSVVTGSSFAWIPEAIRFYDDKRLADVPIKQLIESEIVKNLKQQDMEMVESINGARYAIAYTAALESSLQDSEIIQRFGLLPGMARVPQADKSVEKGSLIIYVFDNRSDEIIWRSAAQVGVGFDTPLEQRKQRVQQVIAEMFQTFPVQKQSLQ